jgi:hypothetical protein
MFAKRPGGPDHEQQWCADLSVFAGRREKATGFIMRSPFSLEWKKTCRIAVAPSHPAIRPLFSHQNVAGLWLKYGVKPPETETSAPSKKVRGRRRFVDDTR